MNELMKLVKSPPVNLANSEESNLTSNSLRAVSTVLFLADEFTPSCLKIDCASTAPSLVPTVASCP